MKVVFPTCCGVDVHKTFLVATIITTPADSLQPNYQKKRFSTFNSDLNRFADWLLEHNCLNVCMESTGKYWVPVFNVLEKRGIRVVIAADAHIPVQLKSSEIDLCCILGNLFDNAIEASMKLPEDKRLIRVYMDMKNTQLYISFTNFTAGKKMQKEGGLFRSTKGEGHGFGLVRIDAIVERLDGYISRNSEDGAFTTEILLPQE